MLIVLPCMSGDVATAIIVWQWQQHLPEDFGTGFAPMFFERTDSLVVDVAVNAVQVLVTSVQHRSSS